MTAILRTDPVDELVIRTAERCGLAIDPLQIAAMLESDGMTDRMAEDGYGYRDVFGLAEEVYRRLPRKGPGPPEPRTDRAQAVRELSHGLLYLMPSAVFPAVAELVGLRGTITAMVCATAVGWVWSMGLSWVAYRMLGHGRPDVAARVLACGFGIGVTLSAPFWLLLSPGAALLVTAQLCYQLAGAILLFHRKESVLFALSLPSVATGLVYVASPGAATAVATSAASLATVALCAAAALWTAYKIKILKEPQVRIGKEIIGSGPIMVYASLSALYLLSADARYTQPSLDLALAVTPVVAGMGVLEWRARRFAEKSSVLLRRTQYPRDFRRRVLARFGAELAVVCGVLSALAAVLGAVLHSQGQLTSLGVLAFAGHVLLGCGYFAGFLLINTARFGRLLAVLSIVAAGYLLAAGQLDPALHVHLFGVCSALLVTGLVCGLLPELGQVHRYTS
ncbi:hypothetical protein [Longispora albida]|uniref:hypothetical protein n=1 Tax=Longispora albida TaxID=203523 RepID=UPI000366656A|nr:hypothetical protein [Longispora albida]